VLRFQKERKEEWIGIICAEGFRQVKIVFAGPKPGHPGPATASLSETSSEPVIDPEQIRNRSAENRLWKLGGNLKWFTEHISQAHGFR